MRVTNGRKFSYPGYQEMLAGFPDSAIDSNAKTPNPNVTVLEWLLTRPGLAGHVAVFGTWDVFPFIVNEERSGIPVNAGWEPLVLRQPTAGQALLNTLMETLPRIWEGERYDALTYQAAREYVTAERPNVLYLALGETDDWAHEDRYDRYLDAARNGDAFIRDLWQTVQADPRYRHRTALVVTTDHGRGSGRAGWSRHGASVADAEGGWAAVLGPVTPARGSRTEGGDATQAQIAATVAALLSGLRRRAASRAPPLRIMNTSSASSNRSTWPRSASSRAYSPSGGEAELAAGRSSRCRGARPRGRAPHARPSPGRCASRCPR
jgi:hypothetical protein